MQTRRACLIVAPVLSLCVMAAASPARAQAPLLGSGEDFSGTVAVQDVATTDRAVSAVLVNKSSRLLRDVRVMIRHSWLWKNERHPGEDNPSRAASYVVPGDIPAGGSLPFTYEMAQPLPQRSDGRFVTTVDVLGFTEVGH